MICRAPLCLVVGILATTPGIALAESAPSGAAEPRPAGDPSETSPAHPETECPDGWFCEPEQPGESGEPAPPAESAEAQPAHESERVVPSRHARDPAEAAPEPLEPPTDTTRSLAPRTPPSQRLGLEGRLAGSLLGSGSSQRTPFMAGLGVAFRLRPLPHFALDAAVDGFRGRDFLGAERTEAGLSVTTVLFFNPEGRYAFYLPAGLFHTWARVDPIEQGRRSYRYVGAFLGLGLELAVDPNWAAFADLLGFLRARSDPRAINEPEYVDLGNGRVTNSSGGALIRVGAVRYF